jgi:predicted TIM-barrel fold metal-dependent hydrolase
MGLTQPLIPPAPEDALADLRQLLALARYPNLAVKITGACTYSRRPFPYDDLWEPLARVIDSFGVDRCMWGTDWTRTTGILSYEQGISAFRDHWPINASEKAALMGETATRIYGW